jgi:hypothetical protein
MSTGNAVRYPGYPAAFAELLESGSLLVAILVKTSGELHVLMLRSEPGFVNWRVVFRVSVPLTNTQEE